MLEKVLDQFPGAFFTLHLLLSILLLGSCRSTYLICEIDSGEVKKEGDQFIYWDSNLKISYDFWSDGGLPLFAIQNLREDTVAIRMDSSYYQVNTSRFPYYDLAYMTSTHYKSGTRDPDYSPHYYHPPTLLVPPGRIRWVESYHTNPFWISDDKSDYQYYHRDISPIKAQNVLYLRYGQKSVKVEHRFWISTVHEATRRRFKRIQNLSAQTTDKFYVKKTPSRSLAIIMGLYVLVYLTSM